MPPGIERRRRGVEDRQRRDGREAAAGWSCGREQLADPAVGDAHHPDLVVPHPRLAGDRLDHVVAVEALQRLEEVEGATRAAGAAHVHVDDREAHQVREDRDAAGRSGRVGVPVARVLDQRRVRRQRNAGPLGIGRARREAGLARRARRRVHVDGELRAVTGGEVRVAVARESTGCRSPGFQGAASSECTVSGRRLQPVGDPAHAVAASPAARSGTAAHRASWRSAS